MNIKNIALFKRLVEWRMLEVDVKKCLKMDQADFLTMLSEGAGASSGRLVSRVEFADLAGVSKTSVYSYFASEGAHDYRSLSDDAKIAMIWRFTGKRFRPSTYGETDGRCHRYGAKYMVNGELLPVPLAALALGYSTYQALHKRIRNARSEPGSDISHLQNQRPGGNITRLYIVSGEEMSINKAAKALGYTASGLLQRLKKTSIPEGADISHLKRITKSP